MSNLEKFAEGEVKKETFTEDYKLEVGKTFLGVYCKFEQVKDKEGKDVVNEQGKPFKKHVFYDLEKEQFVCLPDLGLLTKVLESEESLGQRAYEITYLGKQVAKDGKSYHKFDINSCNSRVKLTPQQIESRIFSPETTFEDIANANAAK